MLGMNSGKNLDQCALAAAFLARQLVNFTLEDGEVDVVRARTPPKRLLMLRISMKGVSPFGAPFEC